jgi:hypothetical protein
MSAENGSSQSWAQFCGWSYDVLNNYAIPVPTTGSMLILKFGKDIQLNDYLAPGSLGNYNFSYTITVTNQGTLYPAGGIGAAAGNIVYPGAIGGVNGAIQPEMVMVTMDSGVFVNSVGTSSVFTGLLSKKDVLNTSMQQPYTRNDVERLVGGSIHDKLHSAIGHVLHHKGHHRSHKSESVVGGSLGTAVSGGAMHHHSKLHKHLKH